MPDVSATIYGERSFTHAQTLDQVARLAASLPTYEVGSGDRVAILALNSDRYYQLLYATAWSSAVVVPVNIRWSANEIAYSLVEAEVRTLVVDDAFQPLTAAVRDLTPDLQTLIHCGDLDTPPDMLSWETLVAEADPIPDAQRRGDDLAGIFYTGGTTGFPKGVMLSHSNLFASAMGIGCAGIIGEGGRVLHAAPMFHLADLGSALLHTALGGSHVLRPAFDPVATWCSAIAEHQVADVLLVPTMIQMIVDHPEVGAYDLSCLQNLTYGASPICEALLLRARKVFSSAAFTQAYGMTELSPAATLLLDEDHAHPVRRRSAGRAAPHVLVKIVDANGNEVPRGMVGEIVVQGENVKLGYWAKPTETAAAVQNGWMHTGDGGFIDEDGFVYIADRIKDMIISGGENVYSVEVENAIAKHPAVAQCAVIGVADADRGERVHAVVCLVAGATLELDELRTHCKQEIAGYKVPRSMDIVDSFPMSGAGKILKRDLRQKYAQSNGIGVGAQ